MGSIGRIALSGISTILESTQTLANLQFDFSIVKVEAPREFHDLGQHLTPAGRETAEDGKLHITARRLGAIFDSLLPQTPQLIKSYGLRASEIARESVESSPKSLGIFAKQAGIDGASIWAGATSGARALQVHLLACMLARMWNGSEATSIWVELLKCRRNEIQIEFDRTGSIDTRTLVAVKQQIDRSDLAEWDASARAWLRVADQCKSLQQKQLLLIIGNLDSRVNSKASVYDSSGDIPLALSSWHIYPDLNLLGPATKLIRQKDPLVPEPGILTVGLNWHGKLHGEGLQWSLPLAHLRYYGDPVIRTTKITTQGSRLTLDEFSMAVLGCVLGSWGIGDEEVENVIIWVAKLSKIVLLFCNAHAQDSFIRSQGFNRRLFMQLVTLGRNHHSFIGGKSPPFFGLSDINRALSIAKTTEQEIGILRSHATSTGMEYGDCIIRYTSDETNQQEYATAIPLNRNNQKRTHSEDVKPGAKADIIREVFVGSVDDFDPEDIGQARVTKPTPRRKFKDIFNSQKERYNDMGEEVHNSEGEHLQSITRAGLGKRVIWGITEMHPRDPWDHWFGPMRHYEYWLGDTESTAMYIRMDQAKPDGQARIPFSGLEMLFEDGNFNATGIFHALVTTFTSLDRSYVASLQAFASLYLLYRALTPSSIDVRILSRPLARTQWFRSLFDPLKTGRDNPSREYMDELEDRYGPDNNFFSVDGDVTRLTPAESCFMDAVRAMEIPTLQPKSPRVLFVSSEESIGRVLDFLRSRTMNTEQSFSCVLLGENSFDISPNRLGNVVGMSSGNSLFVDASLTCDPAIPPRRTKIRHVMGNIGKPGIALLVPPIEPTMMTLGIERWNVINFPPWDGQERDCFADSSLHIWFTGSTQEVDIGYSGAQDKELYIVESVVSLYAKAEWIADLDILKTIESPSLTYRHIQTVPVKEKQVVHRTNQPPRRSTSQPSVICEEGHMNKYQYKEMPLAAVENWTELMTEKEKNCIFLADKNWQARLAAMMICIAQGRKVCLLSNSTCWDCVSQAKKNPSYLKDPVVYIY
ncbi:hypothetical protein NUW58_g5100 [Xylaria curta]|uniref:Uncharacterized protein n=1 Tax=Xylaria curta TaxID=42375 RepID=A0ACC1P4U2_9PEZI|nr:hypothetical protein NUW58_g5100 [Xylaria curta]